uniref:Leucine-rich repeat and coiled-coil domain-containing protein 1 n=1 Tax=Phallusia mammillata TaxID=59560 RepID=A0A6F9DK15_9ASCI|nr:leucine-rich repeat and coiled-coil domain-containing protein 1 [Phallusia mammillata]
MKKVNKQLKCLSTENNKIQEMHKMKSQEIQTELENTKRKHTFATNEVSHLQNRVKELEHLMVQKEEEHRNSIRGLVSYESAEFQCVLDCHLKEERLHQKSEIMQAKEKAKLMDKKYKNLENEFREALCIENHRFMQLRQENQALTEKMCNIESCLKETIEMESKSKSMIRDMTLIIKEQKIKLTETTSSKEECLQQYKKRIQDLELDCENSKRKTVQVEMLKQEKSSLLSQITAMQSVVDGLKEERRQWGRELAQQGSSLAQDRGRLNLKIESLEAEVQSLQKNNERDLNSLKIKSKIVDDQTETILKLKEALSIKDKEIKTKLDESLIEQQRLQQIIDNLHQETCFLNEENASLSLTVKQLKENLVDLNERHIELQDNHANLKVKWSDKVRVLGKLETQVKSVNEKMLLREQKLKEEKESALLTNKKLLQKLEDNYGIHQEQLQALKIAHDDETKRRQIDKDLEVGQLTKQVHDVENEMRMILEDSKKQKILYDGKLNKIKQTFEEMSLNT